MTSEAMRFKSRHLPVSDQATLQRPSSECPPFCELCPGSGRRTVYIVKSVSIFKNVPVFVQMSRQSLSSVPIQGGSVVTLQ